MSIYIFLLHGYQNSHNIISYSYINNNLLLPYRYHNGNDTDAGQHRGFGHVGFLVDNLDVACQTLEAAGVAFKKKPQDGNMRGMYILY